MWVLNSIVGKIFSLLFLPFRSLHPWVAMVSISLLTGLFMLFIFRWSSDQAGICKVKNKIKAHLLEIRLFKDSLPVILQAYGKILRYNARYVAFSAKPMLVMLIPIVLIITHLNLWFGYEALRVDERAILKVFLEERANPFSLEVELRVPAGIAVETPPLRLEGGREINWRIRAKEKGVHKIEVRPAGQATLKTVAVVAARPLTPICPRQGRGFLDVLLYPGQRPISSSTSVKAIEITYPPRRLALFSLKLHWLIPYFVLSLLFGFALKHPFGVEI